MYKILKNVNNIYIRGDNMKKIISIIIIGFMVFSLLSFNDGVKSEDLQGSIANKIIRFHILANSDSDEDQNLKLKVKDAILSYIGPKLSNSKSIDDSRKILEKENANVLKIAGNIIKKNGYNYSVKGGIVRDDFPIKSYGNITLPAGNYEAYKIVIGNGLGHNWWCVMFPPLCFVDITRGEPAFSENQKRMEKVLDKEEMNFIENRDSKEIKFKFKIVELIKKLK